MAEATLNSLIRGEISRLAETQSITVDALESFAQFVIDNHKKKDPKPKVVKPKAVKSVKVKPLTLAQLKEAIYKHFEVLSTPELKRLGTFQMATSSMEKVELGNKKDGWEILYRKLIGVLPHEENETGSSCINGIDVFKYDLPWRVFALDPKTSSDEDVKSAYRELSKIYHPDKPDGNAEVFDRLTTFYKSLTEKF